MEGLELVEVAFRFPVGCYNWFGSCQLCFHLWGLEFSLFFFFFLFPLVISHLPTFYLLAFSFSFSFVSHLFFQHCFASPPSSQSLRCMTVSVRDNEPGVAEEGGAAGLGLFFFGSFFVWKTVYPTIPSYLL